VLTEAFYWDQTDETRAWSKRFIAEQKKVPTMVQAGVYGAVTHYLKAIEAAKTDEGKAVVAKMRELPINDFMTKSGKLREDGRAVDRLVLHDIVADLDEETQRLVIGLVEESRRRRADRHNPTPIHPEYDPIVLTFASPEKVTPSPLEPIPGMIMSEVSDARSGSDNKPGARPFRQAPFPCCSSEDMA